MFVPSARRRSKHWTISLSTVSTAKRHSLEPSGIFSCRTSPQIALRTLLLGGAMLGSLSLNFRGKASTPLFGWSLG